MPANLERALNGILRNWGHDVLLQRRTPDGKDWMKNLERHTVRHMYPSTRGLPQVMQERPEGLVHTVDMIYYFRADAKPREGDRIYESDERYNGHNCMNCDPPGQTTWLIDYALAMRGKRGEVVFYACGVTREEPN